MEALGLFVAWIKEADPKSWPSAAVVGVVIWLATRTRFGKLEARMAEIERTHTDIVSMRAEIEGANRRLDDLFTLVRDALGRSAARVGSSIIAPEAEAQARAWDRRDDGR